MEPGQLQAGLRPLLNKRTKRRAILGNSEPRRLGENQNPHGEDTAHNRNKVAPGRVGNSAGSTIHIQRERPRPIHRKTAADKRMEMAIASNRPSLVAGRQQNGSQAGTPRGCPIMRNQNTDCRQRRRKPPPHRNERGRTTKTIHSNEQAHNPGGNNQ